MLDEANVRHMLYRILEKAQLRRIRFHDLRHTFATLLILQGEWLAYVRDQLGHRSIQVTVDIYGDSVPDGNRAAVDRLDDAPRTAPDVTPVSPAATEKDFEKPLSALDWSGDPDFRQLEPAPRLVETPGGAPSRGVKLILRRFCFRPGTRKWRGRGPSLLRRAMEPTSRPKRLLGPAVNLSPSSGMVHGPLLARGADLDRRESDFAEAPAGSPARKLQRRLVSRVGTESEKRGEGRSMRRLRTTRPK